MPWIIKPALGNVVIEPQTEDEVTASGLILVTHLEKDTQLGEVVQVCDPYESAAGDRSLQQAGPIYSVGEIVIIGKYNGREIKMRQDASRPPERYIIIRESDVLGTLVEVENGSDS